MAKKASKEATGNSSPRRISIQALFQLLTSFLAAAEELLFQEALKGIAAKVNTANITELKNAIDDGVKLVTLSLSSLRSLADGIV